MKYVRTLLLFGCLFIAWPVHVIVIVHTVVDISAARLVLYHKIGLLQAFADNTVVLFLGDLVIDLTIVVFVLLLRAPRRQ